MSRIRVVAISGSLRATSSNAAMLQLAAKLAPREMEFVVYDGLGGLPQFNPDLDGEGSIAPIPVAELRALLAAADGVVISSPEYAHGVPGSLKNALDWLVSTPAMFEKPVVLINAAPAGGLYAQESLAETLRTMGASVLDVSLLAPFVQERVRDDVLAGDVGETVRRSMDALAHAIDVNKRADGDAE